MNDAIAAALEAQADETTARNVARQISCIRGIRGVPTSGLARLGAEAYKTHRPRLPAAAAALDATFGQAYEDGLVAIGLLGACWTDDPQSALDLGLDWADRIDDVQSADALGWLALGPPALAEGAWLEVIDELAGHRRAEGRRVLAAMGLAACPVVVEGPAAAPLREKLGQRRLQMVDEVQAIPVRHVLDRLVRDPDAKVHKALRRLVRAFADGDPEGAVAWADRVPGGLPRLLGVEIKRARRRIA